jgi:hypothetical protein
VVPFQMTWDAIHALESDSWIDFKF